MITNGGLGKVRPQVLNVAKASTAKITPTSSTLSTKLKNYQFLTSSGGSGKNLCQNQGKSL